MLFQPTFPWLPTLILLLTGGMFIVIRQRHPALDHKERLWAYVWGLTAAGALLRLVVWTIWMVAR